MGADISASCTRSAAYSAIYMREEGAGRRQYNAPRSLRASAPRPESCGIAVNDDGVISGHMDTGLVSEVFTEDVLRKLPRGRMAIAHCRYGTTGGQSRVNAQPLVIRHIKGGMALAHNGNLTNAASWRESFELDGGPFSAPPRTPRSSPTP